MSKSYVRMRMLDGVLDCEKVLYNNPWRVVDFLRMWSLVEGGFFFLVLIRGVSFKIDVGIHVSRVIDTWCEGLRAGHHHKNR